MIRWKVFTNEGRMIIGLALEPKDLERMMDGDPAFVRGEKLGVGPIDIVVHYGMNFDSMTPILRKMGIPQELIDAAVLDAGKGKRS